MAQLPYVRVWYVPQIAKVTQRLHIVTQAGILNMSMGFVQTYAALVGVRFVLGVFESGIGAGCVLVIASYYKRFELASKLSIWYLAGIVGSALAGLLAYGIAHMDGYAGRSGWRWIFIVEGAVTAFVAIFMYFWMVDWPDDAKFLSSRERAVLLHRLRNDHAKDAKTEKWNTKRLLGDWRIWIL